MNQFATSYSFSNSFSLIAFSMGILILFYFIKWLSQKFVLLSKNVSPLILRISWTIFLLFGLWLQIVFLHKEYVSPLKFLDFYIELFALEKQLYFVHAILSMLLHFGVALFGLYYLFTKPLTQKSLWLSLFLILLFTGYPGLWFHAGYHIIKPICPLALGWFR